MTTLAVAASTVTLLAGFAIGIPGFLRHTGAMADANNRVLLEKAATQDPITTPENELVTSRTMVAATALSMFTFVILTPLGWVSTYLVASGTVRTIAAVAHDPHGDLLLTAVDATIRRLRSRQAERGRLADRERREGPEVPDRYCTGEAAGWPDLAGVVVSSRPKSEWKPGTVILTAHGTFRVSRVEDRALRGRLRHFYGLAAHTDQEAFRRVVHYELPAVMTRRSLDEAS